MIEHVKFAHLPVFDQDRALAFYRDRLGLEVVADAPFDQHRRWIELAIPGARTRLWFAPREDDAPSAEPSQIFISDDIRDDYERLRRRGVSFIAEPGPAPWNESELYAMFNDSEGNLLVLSQYVR